MEKEKILQARHDVMQQVAEELQDELIPAMLREGGEEKDTDVLRVIFEKLGFANEDGAMGEFFFASIGSEEDTVAHFVSSIIIADDFSDEYIQEFYAAMAGLNTYLPCGTFGVTRDGGILLYKLVTPIPMELTGEALKNQVDICMGNAIAVCDQYADLLLRVLDGDMDREGMFEALGI